MSNDFLGIQFQEALDLIKHLLEEVSYLKDENAKLRLENQRLQAEIVILHDKLNINSSNSGLPTSKEVYSIERKSRVGSGRKSGGQKGHKYHPYELKSADEIIEVSSELKQCSCFGELKLEGNYTVYQSMDLGPIKPVVTEYRLRSKVCNNCGKRYKAKGIGSRKLLGPNIESIISSLGGFFNNSKRDIKLLLKSVFKVDVSLGLISNSENRVSKKLQAKYEELKSMAENSSYLHMDETGAKNKGKMHWCWLAANKEVCVFNISSSRSKKALTQFLPDYQGKAISDRYAVYNIFEEGKRQICLAHLKRDFKRFAHSKNKDLSILGNRLERLIDEVFVLYKSYKKNQIDQIYFLRRLKKVKRDLMYNLNQTHNIPNADQAQRVANNIKKVFEMMWLFSKDEKIEPTNNFAERQIKHYVKYRKNSLFTWSERGERFIERMKSIYASSLLQDLNPFYELQKLIRT